MHVKFPTEPSAIKGYLKQFAQADSSLAAEPESQWYFYADLIQKVGIDVHFANPLKVKAVASAWVKNR